MDKFWHYYNGTVEIKVTGAQPERFINLCFVNKISLSGIKRIGDKTLIARVAAQDVKRLRPVLRKSACRMHIVNKSGLPFFKHKALRRKGFLTGALLFCFFLYILSNFIWTVEINTPKPLKFVNTADLVSKAKLYGLKRGTPKLLVNNEVIRERLQKDFPDASWIGVDISGTKALITIYERAKIVEKESDEPTDLIANKDAVIEDIFVIKGTAVVDKGTTVKKGDTLISSIVYPTAINGQEPTGEPMLERAKGIVRARTWYEARAKISLKEESYIHTGHTTYGLALKIPDGTVKKFRFYDFSSYEEMQINSWQNKSFALDLQLEKYLEIRKKVVKRSIEEAKKEAIKIAEDNIKKELPDKAKLVNKNYIWYNIKNGISVRAIWEVRENIGVNR